TRKTVLQRLPRFLEPRPVIVKSKCVGCGECARACPQKAITVKNRLARIDKSSCIKCYCCQELCKIQAVKVHRSFILKLIH
ncbi:MAG: 4Fe-4S binding protein, partial [Clostridia bacterium]|nr:4Fe-4S binding protein [Clostridia bacterium]